MPKDTPVEEPAAEVPAPDAALAVSAHALHQLVTAAAKHADKDPQLAAALAHFQA